MTDPTDPNDDAFAASPSPTSATGWLARHQARTSQRAALRPANLRALFAALAAAALVGVEVTFDGVGDSGQIEQMDAFRADGPAEVPATAVPFFKPSEDGASAEAHSLPVTEAVEELVYELLEETHAGWEINAGAFGTFSFDVAAGTVRLDYHERIEETLDSVHVF